MKLKDKLTIAREIAAVSLEGFDYLSVSEILDAEGYDAELLTDDIHELITNAIAAEVRGK